jgi:ElaB/YqjD/DUF883 family membrane-anchored ribosome-binding protein
MPFTNRLENLTEDSQALLLATADAAEHKVVEARKRLTAAVEKSKATWERMQEQSAEAAQAADEAIRDHPYQAMGVALGVGVALGWLLRRRS